MRLLRYPLRLDAEGEEEDAEGEGEAGQKDDEDAADSGSDESSGDGAPEGEEPAVAEIPPSQPAVADTEMADDGDVEVSLAEARAVHRSHCVITCHQEAIEALRPCGAVAAIVHLENVMRKEKRRRRILGKQNPGVSFALAKMRDAEDSQLQDQHRRALELTDRQAAASKLKKTVEEQTRLLQKRAAQLADLTKVLESTTAKKRFSAASFGLGRARSGGAAARKERVAVLDRLSKVGSGLSAEQRNEWTWFKAAWDDKMVQEHKEEWGGVFAGWMQNLVNEIAEGADNAFSVFVNNETKRCLDDAPMLELPPLQAEPARG